MGSHSTEQCNGEPTPDKIRGFIEAGQKSLWILRGKVSYHYLCLSPSVNKDTMGAKYCFDPGVYKPKISGAVRQSFAERFAYEYGQ